MKKIIISVFLFLISLGLLSAQCVSGNTAFSAGEELYFYAYYNLGKLWLKAGKASLVVSEKDDNYIFTVQASSLSGWDRIYHLRTLHEACISKDMQQSIYLKAFANENGTQSTDEYYYRDGETYKHTVDDKHPGGRDTVYDYTPCSWDIINAVYVARNLDLQGCEPGVKIPFNVNFSDKMHVLYGEILKREKIKNREGEVFDCIKCSATVAEGTIFAEGKPVYVWITNDERKMPILVECQIMIGSIKVYLYSYKTPTK